MTFSSFQENLFAEPLTSSAADSPASRSVPPESERDETMSDISFRKCFEWWQRYGRVGSSLRTFAGCLVSNLDEYSPRLSHRWKAKGTRSSRFVFLLVPSGPRTDETGCGSLLMLRSPDANMERGTRSYSNMKSRIDRGMPLNLNDQLNAVGKGLLATPLHVQIEDALLLTPTASENEQDIEKFKARGPNQRDSSGSPHLSAQVAMLCTPQADDSKNSGMTPNNRRETLSTQIGGKDPGSTLRLQPAFCEWMMGYPANWTSLEAEITEWPV